MKKKTGLDYIFLPLCWLITAVSSTVELPCLHLVCVFEVAALSPVGCRDRGLWGATSSSRSLERAPKDHVYTFWIQTGERTNRHAVQMTETWALDSSSELTKLLVLNAPWEPKGQQTIYHRFRKRILWIQWGGVFGIPWCVCIPTVYGDLLNWRVQFRVFEIHWLYVLR